MLLCAGATIAVGEAMIEPANARGVVVNPIPSVAERLSPVTKFQIAAE